MDEMPKKSENRPKLPPLPPPPGRRPKKIDPQEELAKLQEELKALRSGELYKRTSTQIELIKKDHETNLVAYDKQSKERNQRLLEHQHQLQFGDDTLLFRYSLEQNTQLVKFVKENLSWLRLIILLYGGISDEGLAAYQIQYDEIAATLHLEENLRHVYIEKLRQKDYWRDNWDTNEDTISNLAIYLEKVGGQMIKHVAETTPEFNPLYIFNDSPLTLLLLAALRTKKEPHTLNNLLWRKWHNATDTMTQAHALIILLLTDTGPAIESLKRAVVDPKMETVVAVVVSHLQKRFYTLKDALILFGHNSKIGNSLNPLIGKLHDNQWIDLVECFYQIYSAVMHKPVKYDEVLLNCMSSLPYINAEIWTHWLSGLNGDDSVYNFAIVLDTLGKKIASASAMTHLHLAHGTKFNQFVKWYIETIPPLLSDPADVVGDALTVAQYSRSISMAQLFHVGIIGFTGIKYSDYPGLLEEALAVTLSLQSKEREAVLEQLDLGLKDKSLFEVTHEIVERTLKIQNHTIRSRALWRVAQNISQSSTTNLWDAATEAAEQIEDPLQQSRAFERLINHLPFEQSLRMREKAKLAARKIDDANNRARALARLALYHDEEVRYSLLVETIETIKQIVAEDQRVEVVKLIRPYLRGNTELFKMSDDIISRINDDWCKRKGTNLLSTKLLQYHSELNEAEKLTPVIVAAFIDDLLKLTLQNRPEQNLWHLILDDNQRQTAIVSLLKMAALNDIQGLALTPEVCRTLQLLLAKGDISSVHVLLPYLQNSDRALLPQLQTWVETKPDEELWRYSGLMLAEAGQLDIKTVPCILELLESGVDMGRYRAILVLHGHKVSAGKLDRQYRASQLGLETILLLGNTLVDVMFEDQYMSNVLGWCWYNISFDDAAILASLIEIAEGSTPNNVAGQYVLGRIDYLDQYMYHSFIEGVKNASMTTVKYLLKAWIRMFHENKPPYVAEAMEHKEIEQLIQNLPADVLAQFQTIPYRALTIASIVLDVSETKNDLDDAIITLEESLLSVSFGLTAHTMEDIATQMFYRWDRDPVQAQEAAEQIVHSESAVKLLFAWLNHDLTHNPIRDLDGDTSFYYKRDTLLLVASECAKLVPATAFNLITEYNLADKLALAAMHQKWFFGRVAAVYLLGYVRQTSANFVTAVLHGLQDVPEVQQATLSMIKNLRYIDWQIVPEVIVMLRHKDTTVIYTAIQILTIIGRHEKTKPNIRTQILNALSTTIKDQYAVRGIFVFEAIKEMQYIRNVGSIDQVAHKAIIDILEIS